MSVLIETSAWIEYFRATGSSLDTTTTSIIDTETRFHTCGPVRMEVCAGARDDRSHATIESVLNRGEYTPIDQRHFDEASSIYRECRSNGITVRSMVDCLIAAIAMDDDLEVLHGDRDFNAIASLFPLRIHPASID